MLMSCDSQSNFAHCVASPVKTKNIRIVHIYSSELFGLGSGPAWLMRVEAGSPGMGVRTWVHGVGERGGLGPQG